MEILNDEQKLALAFINAANRGGYRPLVDEVNAWLKDPAPKFTIGALERFQAGIRLWQRQMTGSHQVESVIDALLRLKWIDVDSFERLALTRLGKALLRTSELLDEESDSATSVVLGANDDLAYPRLIHRLVEAGPGALVDPYLRLEQLAEILPETRIEKFLISELKEPDRASIAVFVRSYHGHPVEVRFAKNGVLHDRLIISDSFVDTIGSSINTVGRHYPTVLTPLPDVAADAMRDYFHRWWEDAELLVISQP